MLFTLARYLLLDQSYIWNKGGAVLCAVCVLASRCLSGAAAERRSFADSSVQLVQALRRALLPAVPRSEAATLGPGRV